MVAYKIIRNYCVCMQQKSTDNFFIKHATTIAIASVTVLMILAASAYYQQGVANTASKGWVNHTYNVRGHIRRLVSQFKEVRFSELGFLLTGNEDYLKPYQKAVATTQSTEPLKNTLESDSSVAERLALIKKLTIDNSLQQRNIQELEEVVNEYFQYIAKAVEMRKNENEAGIQEMLRDKTSESLTSHIDILLRVMEAEESRLLDSRIEIDEINTHQSNIFTLTGIAVFYFLIVLGIWIYQRSRARAQVQALRYTQELERSEEELKMQQEELKASNEEIEASNEEMEEKTKALEEQNIRIRLQSEELTKTQKLIQEKANELERASRYKSEFLANMSHELRTPLNSLLILARMLAANEEGNLTEEQMEEARVIYNGGLELLNLINDILDLSKVEAGKLTITAENVPIDGIVKRLQQQFLPVAKEKGVEFPVKTAPDLPEQIFSDGQRLEQILKNLLSNAFKFTEKGSVTLEIRRPDETIELQRQALHPDNSIAFSVIDTGIGIEASKFKDIFEAFQQEDGSIDRHYGGTGLGLTIARKFAHMLGGEIHVKSEKGTGSSFTLLLPLALVQSEDTESAPTSSEDAEETSRIELKTRNRTAVEQFIEDDRKIIGEKDKVLLIIEDDPTFAATLMKMARKRGYKCICAGDGKTGLLFAIEWNITAIILDLKLPDIDGLQVLDQLKHNLRSRHIPVHIISGRDAEGNVVPLRKGAIGYLSKPADQEAIEGVFGKIQELLETQVKQVLVIEDDKKNQVVIQSLLKKKDIMLTFAGTGSAGLENIKNSHYDCLILDLRLPDMTGFEWLKNAEKTVGERNLPPIIIYTAQELTEEENRNLRHYAESIIIKGAKSPERLLDEVTLFLHTVESALPNEQKEIIRMQHDPDKVLKGRTLLLVDDDLRNTFALSKLLKKHGMNIIIADNGQMALEKLQQNQSIELVIMDIMMPVMDGYQAMREIRVRKETKDLPIIALTARAMQNEQEKCIAAGANDYLTKPVDIERLLTLLRVWLFKQEEAA